MARSACKRLALLRLFSLTLAWLRGAACKELISLGELRFGSIKLGGPFGDQTWWRCMECVTGKQAENVAAKFPAGVSSVPVRRGGRAGRAR